jgi:lysine 2,3-aminomutase
MVSMSDDAVILRNYEGMLIRYQAEDKPQTINPTATRGVSGLLQADRTALIPEGNERMARRKPRVVRDGCGGADTADLDGAIEHEPGEASFPLPMANGHSNGHAAEG